MRRFLLILVLMLLPAAAWATTCPSYPFTLTNGTTADATQTMANFNSILNCVNTDFAPLASPTFTGTPAAPTAAPGTNTTQLATTAFVNAAAAAQGANPSATATGVAINGVATTYMRSDAAPAINLATNLVLGLARGDGSTESCAGGVCSTPSTTINSTTCTPGGSCTVPAAAGTLTGSTLAAGVTASSLLSFGSGPTISGAWTIDDTSGVFSNVPAAGGIRTACWGLSSGGVLSASNGVCGTSDERLKTDWSYDVPGLDLIEQLRPGMFNWLDIAQGSERQIGLTAQSVQKILPEAVADQGDRTITLADGSHKTVKDVLNLDYSKLTLPLIVAVQQQQREIRWLMVGLVLVGLGGFVLLGQLLSTRRVR